MIPQTFEQWKHCITHHCALTLTRDFAQQRLAIYQDLHHSETQQFIQLYGKQHHKNIIQWLKQL